MWREGADAGPQLSRFGPRRRAHDGPQVRGVVSMDLRAGAR